MISRTLAHKVNSRLQAILFYIEEAKPDEAKRDVLKLSEFINAHVESKDEERARLDR